MSSSRKRIRRIATSLTLICAGSAGLAGWIAVQDAFAQTGPDGQKIYAVRCAACHDSGLLGAPKPGDAQQWRSRIAQGRGAVLEHALKGFKQMPPRGGNPGLSDEEVAAAVDFMLSRAEQRTASSSKPTSPASVKAIPRPRASKPASTASGGANSFNRLMKPPSKRNLPPTQDGIHDPTSEGTALLQAPRDAFSALPKSNSGNRVDWVQALDSAGIAPRYDRHDSSVQPVIMDLNIVREVKGSMPNVVYPHKQHTQWLDCSNCHPAIFIPQKGANAMSMAGILLGKQCGVCHGKVAFPVSDCRRCHSGSK